MSETTFIFLKNIFERMIEKGRLEPKYRTARFDEVGCGVPLFAGFKQRDQSTRGRNFVSQSFLRQTSKPTRQFQSFTPKHATRTQLCARFLSCPGRAFVSLLPRCWPVQVLVVAG